MAVSREIEISSWGQGYRGARLRLAVGPGITEAVLDVEKSCGIYLRIFDGDTPIPWNRDWKTELEAVAGDGRPVSWTNDGKGRRIFVSEPGFYRLRLSKIKGFRPVPDEEIRFEVGEILQHDVRLEREQ